MSERDEFDDRDFTTGQFKPGHAVSVKHGLYTSSLPAEYAHLKDALDDFIAGCLVDEGDANDIPTRRKAQLEYRAMLHQHIHTLHAALIVKGYFDAKGRLRATWLQRIEGLIGAAKAIDKELGLERRAKKVPSLEEWIEAQATTTRAETTQLESQPHQAQDQPSAKKMTPQPETAKSLTVGANGPADIVSAPARPIASEGA